MAIIIIIIIMDHLKTVSVDAEVSRVTFLVIILYCTVVLYSIIIFYIYFICSLGIGISISDPVFI